LNAASISSSEPNTGFVFKHHKRPLYIKMLKLQTEYYFGKVMTFKILNKIFKKFSKNSQNNSQTNSRKNLKTFSINFHKISQQFSKNYKILKTQQFSKHSQKISKISQKLLIEFSNKSQPIIKKFSKKLKKLSKKNSKISLKIAKNRWYSKNSRKYTAIS